MTISLSSAGLAATERPSLRSNLRSSLRSSSQRSGRQSPGSQHPTPPSWEDLLGRR
jgi:hypothetical protein|uniref:hypothetical protein n=1 Tax=Synechococcus sp. CS-1329 TaxID=2847975 RepID=UPI00223B8BF5|nr:hypothetical protein [Synechococcus sp. CS-1329]